MHCMVCAKEIHEKHYYCNNCRPKDFKEELVGTEKKVRNTMSVLGITALLGLTFAIGIIVSILVILITYYSSMSVGNFDNYGALIASVVIMFIIVIIGMLKTDGIRHIYTFAYAIGYLFIPGYLFMEVILKWNVIDFIFR